MTTTYTLFLGDTITREVLWSLQSSNLELIAGMLAAGAGIMDDTNYINDKTQYYVDSNADVSSFRIVDSIREEDINSNLCGKLLPGQRGIWLHSGTRFYYSLYGFRTAYFFQGIISICNSFGVDFRNYIYGLPFDGEGNQYALSDYVMVPFQLVQDAPDLDDVEEEEADNENIIETLHKDW